MLHLNDSICLLALKLVALQAGTFNDSLTPLHVHVHALSVPGFHHNYTCTYVLYKCMEFHTLAMKVICVHCKDVM